jgi:hypothetical protein
MACSLFVPEGLSRVARHEMPGICDVRKRVPEGRSIPGLHADNGLDAPDDWHVCRTKIKRPSGTQSHITRNPAVPAGLLSTVPPGQRRSALSQHKHLPVLTRRGGGHPYESRTSSSSSSSTIIMIRYAFPEQALLHVQTRTPHFRCCARVRQKLSNSCGELRHRLLANHRFCPGNCRRSDAK